MEVITMKSLKTIALLLTGAAFGVGTVLSCSGDSPRDTDAATCDCPASEAPIAGRLTVVEGTAQTLQAGEQGSATAGCMPGAQFLSGTCAAVNPTVEEDIHVRQFGFVEETFVWFCSFTNNKATPVQVKATVLCLAPTT
jgi:hypothetical protein